MILAKESNYQWEIGGKPPVLDEHSHIKHATLSYAHGEFAKCNPSSMDVH